MTRKTSATKTEATPDWEPRELVHPDGVRTYTPTSASEENQLVVGGGYRFADAGQSVALADADNPAQGSKEPAEVDAAKASTAGKAGAGQ